MSLELWNDQTQLACDLPNANKFGILRLATTDQKSLLYNQKNTFLSVGETFFFLNQVVGFHFFIFKRSN